MLKFTNTLGTWDYRLHKPPIAFGQLDLGLYGCLCTQFGYIISGGYLGTRIAEACAEIEDFRGKNKMETKFAETVTYLKARWTKPYLDSKNQIFLKIIYYYFDYHNLK